MSQTRVRRVGRGRRCVGSKEQIDELFAELSDEVKQVVGQVLEIETRYLHMALPRGIHDEIVEMVERVVK